MERSTYRNFSWLVVVSVSVVGLLVVWTGLRASAAALDEGEHMTRLTSTPFDSTHVITPPVTGGRPAVNSGQLVYSQFLPLVANHNDSLRPPFGVQQYYALTPQYGLTRIIESKVTWARFPIYWSGIEPANTTPEHYNWSSADTSLLSVTDTQVNLVVTLAANPVWAAPTTNGPVNNLADLLEFVGAIVARYPHVRYWEFYNEPDNVAWYGLKGAAYANMLKAVYPVVKAANPSAQVVMGGLGMDWFSDTGGPFDRNFLRDVLANCSGPCFDMVSFHYYPSFRNIWAPYGRDIIGKANYIRQLLATYQYVRPIMSSETSWPSVTTWGSPELQARYLPKVYVRSMVAGLSVAMWYSLFDVDYSKSGLLDVQLNTRPAYETLRALVTTMPQPNYVRTIPVSETGSSLIEAYQFTVAGPLGFRRLDVYWYDCPSMTPISGYPSDCDGVASLRLKAPQVVKIDKLGNRTILDQAPDGYITLDIRSSPIFIDYAP